MNVTLSGAAAQVCTPCTPVSVPSAPATLGFEKADPGPGGGGATTSPSARGLYVASTHGKRWPPFCALTSVSLSHRRSSWCCAPSVDENFWTTCEAVPGPVAVMIVSTCTPVCAKSAHLVLSGGNDVSGEHLTAFSVELRVRSPLVVSYWNWVTGGW